jgi:hypothetical protein
VLTLAAAVALAAVLPAAAGRRPAVHFKVLFAQATAKLTFRTSGTDERPPTQGTARLMATQKAPATGSVPGKALAAIKGTLKERVKTKVVDPSGESPYQETCSNTLKIRGKGGFTLRKSGETVEAEWAFPQARFSFCEGPKPPATITLRMRHLYAASVFKRARTTIVIAGSGTVQGETTLAYEWRATVKIARLVSPL